MNPERTVNSRSHTHACEIGVGDRVLVPLPDGRWLALAPDVFREALEAGSRAIAAPAPSAGPSSAQTEPLLSSDELSHSLGVPESWIDQKAREGLIPSFEFGRWRRFKRSEVEAAVRKHRSNT